MTNYNERFDEILDIFHNKMLALETITNPCDEPSEEIDRTFDEAKQALTSLFEELVAEAKPKTMPSNLTPENYERCERVVNQYHQNLLKALSNNGKAE